MPQHIAEVDREETFSPRSIPKFTSPLQVIPASTDGVDMAKLVGVPHLFGRVKQLRNGLLIDPISTLTMQPGGGITGYGHPKSRKPSPSNSSACCRSRRCQRKR